MSVNERIAEIDRILSRVSVESAFRWCEPDPEGCFCMGCANASAGLTNLGYTKEEWEAWKRCKRGIE